MRLIDADALRNGIREAACEGDVTVRDVLTTIDLFPAIEAEPVRHGRWVKKHQTYTCGNMTLSGVYPTCTLCGHAEIGVDKSTPYCPNCGAKMDAKKEQ